MAHFLHTQNILGIRFYVGDMEGLQNLTRKGGLIVAPSAPVLADLTADPAHRAALESSDIAITDSGFMVLLWRLFRGQKLPRISGLKYLRALFESPEFRIPNATFWIMPSTDDATANFDWLQQRGMKLTSKDCYVAPVYLSGALEDPQLLALIEARMPKFVILCIGGGVQERLGHYLKINLSAFRSPNIEKPEVFGSRPALICTGAAIAFLSRRQANIPVWADKLMLGWFLRCIREPAKYVPRYLKALRLIPLLWRHGECPVE
jgi:N-acetylglucosaminyldiphosphoundecaprenol N-acetyl-beta-D-mannosaminyltransferase